MRRRVAIAAAPTRALARWLLSVHLCDCVAFSLSLFGASDRVVSLALCCVSAIADEWRLVVLAWIYSRREPRTLRRVYMAACLAALHAWPRRRRLVGRSDHQGFFSAVAVVRNFHFYFLRVAVSTGFGTQMLSFEKEVKCLNASYISIKKLL